MSDHQPEHVITADPGEVALFMQMPAEELVERYSIGIDVLDQRVFEVGTEDIDRAWPLDAGVGKWPIRVLIGHLADAEIAFTQRMRRIAAEPGSQIHTWDEQAFIDAGHYGVIPTAPDATPADLPIGASVAAIHTLRQWNGLWLRSIPAEFFTRSAMHPERGPMTLQDVLAYDVWHFERHAWFCNRKVTKLLGDS